MPKYCIVIPSYNSEATILESVISAINANHNDFSVVVSDNASSDNTASIISAIESKNLRFINNNSCVSKSDNWNRAYSQADDCKYFINLHSDDILHSNAIRYIDKYTYNDPILIHGADIRVNFDNSKILKRRYFPFGYSLHGENQKKSSLLGNSISIVGTTIDRLAFEKVGGWDAEYNFYQDVELWYRLASIGRNIYIPKRFGRYRAPNSFVFDDFIYETIKWYEAKLDIGLSLDLEESIVIFLNKFVNNNLLNKHNLSDGVVSMLLLVQEKYKHKSSSFYSPYLISNFIKLKGMFA